MINLIILLSSVALVTSHDVFVGTNNLGRKIFDENLQASPAIWIRTENVTVNATDSEVISRIIVTDLRPEKDGHIKIIDGGEGHKTVTVELQSPAVFRGYDFHVEVYAAPEGQVKPVDAKSEEVVHGSPTRITRNPEEITIPSHPIQETKNIVLSEVNPTTEVKINENEKKIDFNTETRASDLNTNTTPDLKHMFNEDNINTSIKPETEIPAVAGHTRLVRDDKVQNKNNESSRHLDKSGINDSFYPILTAKKDDTETTNTKSSYQNNNRKLTRDTKHEVMDDSKKLDINSTTTQAPSSIIKTAPSVNRPENIGYSNIKGNDKAIITDRSFIPPSRFVTEKRQAHNVENEEKKDSNIPAFITHKENERKSIENEKPTDPNVNEQPVEQQNTGAPNIYYPLSYSTSTTEKSENESDLQPKISETQGKDKDVHNIPQAVLNHRNLQHKPVVSTQ